MSDVAIQVEGLGKRFSINARQESYQTLRDSLANVALMPFRTKKSRPANNGNDQYANESIWALKDVATLYWHGGSGEQNDQRHQSCSTGEEPEIVSYVHRRKGHACTRNTLARCYRVHQPLSSGHLALPPAHSGYNLTTMHWKIRADRGGVREYLA